jgi:hypothetical protein
MRFVAGAPLERSPEQKTSKWRGEERDPNSRSCSTANESSDPLTAPCSFRFMCRAFDPGLALAVVLQAVRVI